MKLLSSKKKFVLHLLLPLFLIVGIFISLKNPTVSANALKVNFSNEPTFNKEYFIGDTLTIERASMDVNGQAYAASSVMVTAPDGTYYRYKFNDNTPYSFVISEAGGYEIVYNTEINGVTYTSDKALVVSKELYGFTDVESNTEYIENSQWFNQTGVKVNLKLNDVFTYNRILDLNEIWEKGVPFVDLFPLISKTPPARDYAQFCIKLTDVYDPENFITIYSRNPNINDGQLWEKIYTYTRAAAPGQPFVGIDWGFDGKPTTHKNSPLYGHMTECSFYGQEEDFYPVGSKSLAYYMDLTEKQLFVDNADCDYVHPAVDFDDSAYMSAGWEGFTTGEAYLSISLSGQGPDVASFFIKSVAGHDITNNSFVDELGAKLTIDTDYEVLPNGRVDTKYPIPAFTATSSYSDRVVLGTRVYYGYGTEEQYQCSINDGYFLPKEVGEYTLIYSAKDVWGNLREKVYTISIKETLDPLKILLDESETEGYAGFFNSVSKVISDGGTGKHTVKITAENLNNGTVYEVVTATKGLNTLEYDLSNDRFLPMSTGHYKISYTVSDYIDTKEVSYLLKIDATEKPVIVDDVNIPQYLIKGKSYTLPKLTAYDFYNVPVGAEPLKVDCDVFVTENGTDRQLTGNVLKTELSDKDVQIKYQAQGGTPLVKDAYVIDVNWGQTDFMANYFVGTNEITATADNVGITVTTQSDNKIDFINSVLASTFAVDYSFVEDAKFGKLNFYLTDSVDKDVCIKVTVQIIDGRALYYLNDDYSKTIINRAVTYGEKLTLSFDKDDNAIVPIYGFDTYVLTSLNGEKFTGFPSFKINLSFDFESVEQSASLKLYSINNQGLSKTKYDQKHPEVYITSNYLGLLTLEDTLVVSPFVVADVLDPEATAYVTVRTPNGKFVTAQDGTVMDRVDPYKEYKFKPTVSGRYIGTIYVCDSTGNEKSYTYNYNVFDTIPPVIEVSDTVISGKVGEEIMIPTAIATDETDGAVEIIVTVTSPQYRTTLLEEVNAFVPQFSGTYTITYMAYDSNGNLALETVKVIVSNAA